MNKQHLRNEIVRCGKDPNYFIRKYVKIRHPVRGLIPFTMFPYQEDIVKDYLKHRFNIILKARQLGISEVTASFAAWLMLFHRDKNILVMATKAETAKNIIRKVQTALKKIPSWLMLADITTDNKMSLELTNGSIIKAVASSDDAGRSEALSLLIIDEAAFIKNMDELWTGLLPTVQAGGRVVVLSTPSGVGNTFHKLFMDSERKGSEFHSNKLMWWLHPERIANIRDDPNRPGFKVSDWYLKETKNMSPREIAQELECNFNASGDTVVSAECMEWLEQGSLNAQFREWSDRNLFVWWKPIAGRRYFITADVARGDGKDHSAFHVWNSDNMEQNAEYYGKIPPDEFARLLCQTGIEYNNAMLVIENNSIGLACIEHVKLASYPNVYYSRRSDSKPGESVNTFYGPSTDDLVSGFTMSSRTRPLVIAKLEEYIRNRSLIIRSKRLVEELRTFIWLNGRPEAMRGYNDDLIVAAAIGAWIRDTAISPNFVNVEAQKKMLETISTFKTTNVDIPGASKNPNFVSQRQMGSFTENIGQTLQIRMPNGEIADFSWLLSKG
jgi:hypothetical protein